MDRRVLLVVLDGLGYSRSRLAELQDEAWSGLDVTLRDLLLTQAGSVLNRRADATISGEELARNALLPVAAETLPEGERFDDAIERLEALSALATASAGTDVMDRVHEHVRAVSSEMRYVPVAAQARHLADLRNRNLTMPTSAAGRWAGFEDVDPPVQGNSDTGHQQITNLRLAPQLPLEITRSIDDGSFFRNPELTGVVARAVADGRNINFTILLSGMGGADGRVHSAWNHLQAFLRLVFEVHGADPRKVRMQAVLDGRDSSATSSLDAGGDGATGAYIDRLEELLETYGAARSLAWVVGRNVAMDRDYREPNVRADYLLLTRGEGRPARGFRGLKRILRRLHSEGMGDSDIPPIVLPRHEGPPVVAPGDAFINLNFRADRQRARMAALAGARAFLERESRSRGRSWTFEWLRLDMGLDLCGMADYHPELVGRYGMKVAFTNRPNRDNILALFPTIAPTDQYLLVGESVKELHVGYFLRGRREAPEAANCESREIIPSHGEQDGVANDSDVYKTPAMRAGEIARTLVEAMASRRHLLICANLASTDMLGHLLPNHFQAAVDGYQAVDSALARIIPVAREFGYYVIVTSDHGNIEDDTPSHSVNDVLTTVIAPRGRLVPARRETFQARLYDVSWTVGRLLGVESEFQRHLARTGDAAVGGPEVGRPIIEPI